MQIFDIIIFFEVRTLQQKTVKPTCLCPLGARKLAEGKGHSTDEMHAKTDCTVLWTESQQVSDWILKCCQLHWVIRGRTNTLISQYKFKALLMFNTIPKLDLHTKSKHKNETVIPTTSQVTLPNQAKGKPTKLQLGPADPSTTIL